MKLPKSIVMLGLLVILLAGLSTATSVDVEPINKTSHQIFFDEVAVYRLTIDNTADSDRVFNIGLNPLNWVVDSDRSISVDANSEREVELLVRPRPSNFRGPGLYNVPLEITTNKGETFDDNLKIVIKSIEERLFEYKPSVAMGISADKEINPKNEMSLQMTARNRNLRNLENITLIVEADHFSESRLFSLSSLDEKSFELRFDIPDDAAPGTYELEARLRHGNQTLSEAKKYYDILPYADIDRETVTSSSKLFKQTRISKVTNKGNVEKSIVTDLDISLFEDIFTSVSIDASSIEKKERTSWKLTLQPQETASLTVQSNYRPLVALALLIVLVIIGYFVARSPITLKKQVIVTGKDEEGVSEMKVRIYLRNRTGKAFYNIRLLDKAPAIAHVSKSNALGSVDPTKIVTTENKGTVIKWDFDNLEAFEERIVTYTIRARLKIIGNIGLPRVKVRFENENGKARTTESDNAKIGATS